MYPLFANQLETFDYLNIDIMARELSEEEKTAVEAMTASNDDLEDSQRESMYDPVPPLSIPVRRERSLSPERYVTPPPRVYEPDVRDVGVSREQRREARRRTAELRSMAIAAIGREQSRVSARRELFPVQDEATRTPDVEVVPTNSTISSTAPGPLVLPPTSFNAPELPPRTPIQAQVAPAVARAGTPYADVVLHHIDISSLVSPYVIELDRDPRNLPAGIPAEHANAWRRLVQIGIMISHYTQLIMTDCEVHTALEQATRILTAYNGLGIRRLFSFLRSSTDVRSTHLYDLHNGYKRFFIAAAAQLNQAHILPSTRVSNGARVFAPQQ